MPVFFHYLVQIFASSLTRICDVLTIYHDSNPIYDWSSFKPISTNKSHFTLTWILILLLFCIYLLYMYVCWNLITLYICFHKNIKKVGKSQPLYLVKLRWYISDFVIYVYLTRTCTMGFYQIWLRKICLYAAYLDIWLKSSVNRHNASPIVFCMAFYF